MKALILAAGYGTRLYPLTKNRPKPLLLINKKPLINHLLGKVKEANRYIDEVFIVTNDKFYTHFKDWESRFKDEFKSLSIKVINDGSTSPEDRRGAIGDVSFVIKEEAIKDDILVIGGDNLFDEGIEEFIKFSLDGRLRAAIGLFDIKDKKEASKFGVAALGKESTVISFDEKPKHPQSSLIAMCLYYFSQDTFSFIEQYLEETGKHDTTGDFIKWLYPRIAVFGFIFRGRWDDIGHIDSLCNWEEDYCKFKERSVKE